jgi:hypothetical protein
MLSRLEQLQLPIEIVVSMKTKKKYTSKKCSPEAAKPALLHPTNSERTLRLERVFLALGCTLENRMCHRSSSQHVRVNGRTEPRAQHLRLSRSKFRASKQLGKEGLNGHVDMNRSGRIERAPGLSEGVSSSETFGSTRQRWGQRTGVAGVGYSEFDAAAVAAPAKPSLVGVGHDYNRRSRETS